MVAVAGGAGIQWAAPTRGRAHLAHSRRRVVAHAVRAELWRKFGIAPDPAVGAAGSMGLARMRGLAILERFRQKLAASVGREPERAPAVAVGGGGHLAPVKESALQVP